MISLPGTSTVLAPYGENGLVAATMVGSDFFPAPGPDA